MSVEIEDWMDYNCVGSMVMSMVTVRSLSLMLEASGVLALRSGRFARKFGMAWGKALLRPMQERSGSLGSFKMA